MTAIYEPRGRAGEYAELACNLYSGCGHACTYCYAPKVLKTDPRTFRFAKPRKNILEELEQDAKELNGDSRSVLLCFTCDPYQPIDCDYQLTRRAIQILHRNNMKVTILTKGGKRSERDFDLLALRPDLSTYAVTLVFTDEAQRQKYEPCAAPTKERIHVLARAHRLGIPTWVSLEPVFDPEDAYKLIDQTHEFVDLFKVGKLNYSTTAQKVDWGQFCHKVVELLESLDKKYYIKRDLMEYW